MLPVANPSDGSGGGGGRRGGSSGIKGVVATARGSQLYQLTSALHHLLDKLLCNVVKQGEVRRRGYWVRVGLDTMR